MKQIYQAPAAEICRLLADDVLTASPIKLSDPFQSDLDWDLLPIR